MIDKPKSNPNLDKFLEEVNKLGQKYHFQIVPTLVYGKEGIIPSINIVDTSIKKTKSINGEPKIPNIGEDKLVN